MGYDQANNCLIHFYKRFTMKKRTIAKRADVAPTGMLDAYTEGPANSAMSDSAKFKEGYKKKGKGKQKNIPKKVETEDDQETKEEPEEKESWEDDVVESWGQLEVEQMPVPQKVEQKLANLRLSNK